MSRAIPLLPLRAFDFCYRVNFKLQLQCHEVPEPTEAGSIGAEYQKQIQEIFLRCNRFRFFLKVDIWRLPE
jgi:hypothetical protein